VELSYTTIQESKKISQYLGIEQALLNNTWIKEDVPKEIEKNILNEIKIRIHLIKICVMQQKQCLECNVRI
jgi:hypothetical protein